MTSPWKNREEAADYLGVTSQTLAQMAHRGTGPRYSKPSGRLVRYHVDDLDAWLRDHSRVSSLEPASASSAVGGAA